MGVLDGVVEILDGEGNVIGYEENTQAVDGQTYWASRAWGGPTDWFVLDGSYISLREVMLSYSFQPSALANTPIAGITLSLVGRNLLYLEEHMEIWELPPKRHRTQRPVMRGLNPCHFQPPGPLDLM